MTIAISVAGIFNGTAPEATALSIRLGATSSSQPFQLSIDPGASQQDVTLQIANDSATAVSVLGWQLDLILLPLSGSQGSLSFYDAIAPPDPLFPDSAEPLSDPNIPPPSDHIFVQDMSTNFSGSPIPSQSARNIVQLTLAADTDISGSFELVIPIPVDAEVDSSWFDANDFTPKFFDNSYPSTSPDHVLLGTITADAGKTPRPVGDYDSDGSVGNSDYNRWRSDFGRAVETPGDGADGNRNGFIDAADYVIWRAKLEQHSAESMAFPVPEPSSYIVFVMMGGSLFSFHRHLALSPRLAT